MKIGHYEEKLKTFSINDADRRHIDVYPAKILIIAKGLAICEVGGYMITCKREQVRMLIFVIIQL